MMPRGMEEYLGERLPAGAWENRLIREGGWRFVEFGPTDVDRLARLGSDADHLGPRLVVGMWDEPSPLEVGGYLVVDNLALGRPAIACRSRM